MPLQSNQIGQFWLTANPLDQGGTWKHCMPSQRHTADGIVFTDSRSFSYAVGQSNDVIDGSMPNESLRLLRTRVWELDPRSDFKDLQGGNPLWCPGFVHRKSSSDDEKTIAAISSTIARRRL